MHVENPVPGGFYCPRERNFLDIGVKRIEEKPDVVHVHAF